MKRKFLLIALFASSLSLVSLSSCEEEIEETPDSATKEFLVKFDDNYKFNYMLNDKISHDGLSVFDKKTNEEITYYYISPAEGMRLSTPGDIDVTISLKGYEDYVYQIHVKDDGTYVEKKTINLYSVNDFHGSFIENGSEIGMSKLSSFLINQKENGAIILSAGDMWQGGVESNLTNGKIVVDAMNHIGFDAMTVGNHEFDWGFDILEENISDMSFPMLCANGYDKRTGERFPYFDPYVIVEKEGLKIGVIGSGAESFPSDITYSVSQYLDFRYQIPFIKEYSDYLRSEEDCDAVILLAHDGGCYNYEGDPYIFEDVCEVSPLTNEKYVDGIFLGHDHDEKSGTYKDVVYAEGGSNGEYVSHIALNFEEDENDELKLVSTSSRTIRTSSSNQFKEEDSFIDSLLDKYKDELSEADKVICYFPSYQSRNDILELVCEAMISYANDPKHESILIDDQEVTAAAHNTGGVRDSVSSGAFTYRDLIKVLPFDNTLCIVKLTSSQFDTWQNSGNHFIGTKGSGTYSYLATINYLGDNVDYLPRTEMFDTKVVIQDVFIEYLSENYN